jgi:uncharacterized protein YuzE
VESSYYPEDRVRYVYLTEEREDKVARSDFISELIVLDYNDKEQLIGIEAIGSESKRSPDQLVKLYSSASQ